ncbi:MAG: hypothetical protein M1835_004495 [Candelina submexicana]|nr:MAG: hypothetical protein M1835_004495 [Candelina submexicana]
MDSDFQERSNAFWKWLLEEASAKVNSNVKLIDLRGQGAGRGLVALADLEKGEELFTIPRTAIISVQNSALSEKLRSVLEDLDPWLSLIVVLIYERLQGPDSKWKPYLDIHPQQFDSLMFWSQQELSELQGSAVVHKIGKEEADTTFRDKIVPIVISRPDLFDPANIAALDKAETTVEAAIVALAHIMGSTVMAYAFDIEDDSEDQVEDEGFVSDEEEDTLPKGMVPMADIVNADADRNNARLFYNKASLTMKALRSIRQGEEILNDYGPLPRSDLLRRYGYITNNYAQYDVVEVSLNDVREITTKAMPLELGELDSRLAYLSSEGWLDDGYDISRAIVSSSVFPLDLVALVRTLLLSPAVFSKTRAKKQSAQACITLEVAEVLQSLVLKRQADYSTSVDEDKSMLQDPFIERRKKLAVQVRIGEKEILRQALAELRAFIADARRTKSSIAHKRDADEHVDEGVKKLKFDQ